MQDIIFIRRTNKNPLLEGLSLEEAIKTKSSATLYFQEYQNGVEVTRRIITGYDENDKVYFRLGDKNSQKSNKAEFIDYIVKTVKKMWFVIDKKQSINKEFIEKNLKKRDVLIEKLLRVLWNNNEFEIKTSGAGVYKSILGELSVAGESVHFKLKDKTKLYALILEG